VLDLTVLISSSPILSHPSTHIIDETIRSIRWHLPEAPIFVMTDGVRDEQAHLKEAYRLYRSNLVTKMLLDWRGVMVLPFPEFSHQAVMTIKTLEIVQTPLILFVEHDTPLVERFIDWDFLTSAAHAGLSPMIRLHYDETIHREHEHLMRGELTPNLIKTVQWSQRPHLANKNWYGDLLLKHFTPESRTFIEDKIYGVVVEAPWEQYQLTIYNPEGTGQRMKRSRDLNGRGEEQKYGMVF
jgi:hypothetical protein